MRRLEQTLLTLVAILGMAIFAACGDHGNGPGGGGNPDGGNDGGNNIPRDDAGNPILPDAAQPPTPDAGPPSGCDPNNLAVECNNCIDDDNDGDIDGFDVHCISALDRDESSFATGIPGDNMDMTWQDCFFDGNSGGGQDCKYHYCCLLADGCPDSGFDPVADCAITQSCIDMCMPLTPPGCDCFGCCTICNDAGECSDVVTNPAVAPDCDVDATGTPVNCPACIPSTECGTACEPENCILCPGMDPSDLPATCNGAECPEGRTPCNTSDDCTGTDFCLNGCCTKQIG